jgi:signal transduction histidine kinase
LRAGWSPEHPSAGRYVFLEVADSGEGIGAEVWKHLFEPFYSTKFVGRGLGLAATLGIMRGYGGAILVRSEPGAGSAFTLLWPAAA